MEFKREQQIAAPFSNALPILTARQFRFSLHYLPLLSSTARYLPLPLASLPGAAWVLVSSSSVACKASL